MNFKPNRGDLALLPLPPETEGEGGVVLVGDAKKAPMMGVVAAIGDPARTESGVELQSEVTIGDTVAYSEWGVSDVAKVEDQVVVIVAETHLLGILQAD